MEANLRRLCTHRPRRGRRVLEFERSGPIGPLQTPGDQAPGGQISPCGIGPCEGYGPGPLAPDPLSRAPSPLHQSLIPYYLLKKKKI